MSDDRSIRVRLLADVQQYRQAMAQAGTATADFGRQISTRGQAASRDIEKVGHTALLAGSVMAVGFAKGMSVAADFEKEMSGVRAVSGASADEMGRLSKAAIAAGADVRLAGVTASDAARAESELVKAGVSVSDVLGGALMGSLTLAAAGQIDFAAAATIAAQSMNIFHLKGGAVGHVADVLAAAANKSAADVGQLGDALRQGGLVASQTGLSLEETVGALAAFADNALIGSDAGTSLKVMLQRLTPQSKESAALMDKLGFSAYDAQGNFVGLAGLADELQTSLAGMTVEQRNSAMATLFGSDAVRGANVLYEKGAAGIRDYVDAVNDQGAAARMAAIQNDNLKGDIEALGGALQSVLIENGGKANSSLRFLTQHVTDLVSGFSAMPEPIQTAGVGLAGFATAGTLAVGVIGTLAPKALAAKTALEGMGTGGAFLARNLGTIASATVVAGAGFAVFSQWEAMLAGARSEAEKWASSWKGLVFSSENTQSLATFKTEISDVNFQWGEMADKAASSKAPWDADYRAQMNQGADALKALGAEGMRIIDISEGLARTFGVTGDAALQFVLKQRNAGVDVLAGDYDSVATAMGNAFGQMPAATTQIGPVTDALSGNAQAATDAKNAFKDLQDAYRASVDPLFGMLDALDKNREAQDAQGKAATDGAAKVRSASKSVADAEKSLASSRASAARSVQDAQDALSRANASGDPGQIASAQRQLADAQASAADQVASAVGRLTDAQSNLTGVQKDANITVEEAAGFNRDAAKSALDVELAAQTLATAVHDGSVSLEDAKGKLAEWVTQGLITQGQADAMSQQFDTAAQKADILAGDYVVTVSEKGTAEVMSTLDKLIAKLGVVQGNFVAGSQLGILYGIPTTAPTGVPSAPAPAPASTSTRYGKAGGGLVPSHLAGGGFPGSPSGVDTVPVWAQPGEFMLRKGAVDKLGLPFLSMLNHADTLPAASMMPAAGADNSKRITLHGGITLQYPREDAALSIPRALRKLEAAA